MCFNYWGKFGLIGFVKREYSIHEIGIPCVMVVFKGDFDSEPIVAKCADFATNILCNVHQHFISECLEHDGHTYDWVQGMEFEGGIFRGLRGPILGSDRISQAFNRDKQSVLYWATDWKEASLKTWEPLEDDFGRPVRNYEKLIQEGSNGVCKGGQIPLHWNQEEHDGRGRRDRERGSEFLMSDLRNSNWYHFQLWRGCIFMEDTGGNPTEVPGS